MFSQDQLQELLSYNQDERKVISLYLNSDTTAEPMEAIKLRVRGMLKEAQASHTKGGGAIERYLDHSFDWSKPGMALFCSTDGEYFQVYPTEVSFRNRIRLGSRPYVKPLAHLLDHYAHFGVILVDRIGARFFEFHLGEVQATDGHMGEDARKLKKGGGSSAVGMRGGVGGNRHEEEVATRNLKEAAQYASQFFSSKPIRRLFIGGTSETVAQFQEMLPKKLQSSLAGSFAVDMNASEQEVGRRAIALLQEANAKREASLVQELLSASAHGGQAVVNLDETLQAVSDKRVQTLIISDGYHAPGYVHEESDFMVANLTKSPLSDRELKEVDDVIEAAVSQTLRQGGHVEVIAGNLDLDQAGKIGAILRY